MKSSNTAEYYPIKTEEDGEENLVALDGFPILSDAKRQQRLHDRGRWSCCKICLVVTVFVLSLFIGMGVAVFCCAYRTMAQYVTKFTVTTPRSTPIVDVNFSTVEAAKERAVTFYDEIIAGNIPGEDLIITEDEVNGFFGHDDFLCGRAYVNLTDNKITLDVSLPTDGLPGGRDRYFVATAYENTNSLDQTILLDLETAADLDEDYEHSYGHSLLTANFHWYMDRSNFFTLHLVKGMVFGLEAPQEYTDQHQNLIECLYDDDEASQILHSIAGITVQNNRIVVTPKRTTTNNDYKNIKPVNQKQRKSLNLLHRVRRN